jgi:hypothetical protein
MGMSTETEEVFATFMTQTSKAILIHNDIEDTNVWIPKSICDYEEGFDELEEGEAYKFMVATWFAEREGLI